MGDLRNLSEGAKAATIALATALICLVIGIPLALFATDRLRLSSPSVVAVPPAQHTPVQAQPAEAQHTETDSERSEYQPNSSHFYASDTYKPPVAENGSRYGEISENTGRPKTVYVRGYYRKDGTYVRGHYRSSSRR